MLSDKWVMLSNVSQASPKCNLIKKIYYTQNIFQEWLIQQSVFTNTPLLQALGNSGILQFHGIMECKNKVAKCPKTSLEVTHLLQICRRKHDLQKKEFWNL